MDRLSILLLTLFVSAVSGILFKRMKVPGGMLVGAIIGSLILSLMMGGNTVPSGIKLTAQILAGTFIGSSMGREDFMQLKKVFKPAFVMLSSLFTVNILAGISLWKIGYADLLTSFMCMAPGGMSDIPLIAADMGCDISKIMVVHFFRLISGLGFFPTIIMWYESRANISLCDGESTVEIAKRESPLGFKLIIMLGVCSILGFIAKELDIPSGAIVFSILGALVLNLFGFSVTLPLWMRRIAQVLTGAYLGCQLDLMSLSDGGILISALFITLLFFLVNCLITGTYICKKFSIPLKESMMMLIPAGASDMALISADMGVNSPRLTLLHISRVIIVTSLFPQVCIWISEIILR